MENYIIYYLVVLLFAGLISFVVAPHRARLLSQITLIGSMYFPIMIMYKADYNILSYFLGGFDSVSGIELKFSKLHLVFLLLISIVSLVSSLFVKTSVQMALIMIASFGFAGLTLTSDLFNAYVFIEVASISTYGLAYNKKNDISALYALHYLMIATVSACIFLLGVGLLYAATGSLNIYTIAKLTMNTQSSMTLGAAVLIVISLCFKVGIYPVSLFFQKVYRSASSSSLLYLSTIPSVTYIMFLAKLFGSLFMLESYSDKLIDEAITMYLMLSALITAFIVMDSLKLIDVLIGAGFVSYAYLMVIATKGKTNIILPVVILDILIKSPFILLSSKIDNFVGGDVETYIIKDKFSKILISFFGLSMIGLPLSMGFYTKVFVIPSLLLENVLIMIMYFITSIMLFKGLSNHIIALFRPKHLANNVIIRYQGIEKAGWIIYMLLLLGVMSGVTYIVMGYK